MIDNPNEQQLPIEELTFSPEKVKAFFQDIPQSRVDSVTTSIKAVNTRYKEALDKELPLFLESGNLTTMGMRELQYDVEKATNVKNPPIRVVEAGLYEDQLLRGVIEMHLAHITKSNNSTELETLIRQYDTIWYNIKPQFLEESDLTMSKLRLLNKNFSELFPNDVGEYEVNEDNNDKLIEFLTPYLDKKIGPHTVNTIVDNFITLAKSDAQRKEENKTVMEIFDSDNMNDILHQEGFNRAIDMTVNWFEGIDIKNSKLSLHVYRRQGNHSIKDVELVSQFNNPEIKRLDMRSFPLVKDGKPGSVPIPGGRVYTFPDEILSDVEEWVSRPGIEPKE